MPVIESNSLRVAHRHIYIILLPVLVFLAGIIGTDYFGHYPVEYAAAGYSPHVGYVAGGRYLFFAAFLLFVFAACSAIAVFVQDYFLFFDKASRQRLAYGGIGIALIFAVFILLAGFFSKTPHTYELLGEKLFEDAMATASAGIPDWVPHGEDKSPMLGFYFIILRIANVFTTGGIAAAILGTISCLAEAPGETDKEKRELIHIYQLERLRKYLYLSSLLLVCGMLLIMSWLYWPGFMFEPESKELKAFTQLANGVSAYFGVNYSMVLLAYYLPVVIILGNRADDFVDHKIQSSETKVTIGVLRQWRLDYGAAVSLPSTYRSAFAIVSPLLTGSLGAIFSAFTASG